MLDYPKLRDAQRTPHDWIRSLRNKYQISPCAMKALADSVKKHGDFIAADDYIAALNITRDDEQHLIDALVELT